MNIGQYNYNKHGVCINPTRVLSHIEKKKISYEIVVAQNKFGWAYGYDYSCNSSLTGTGGGASGVGLDDDAFETKEKAALVGAQKILEKFNRYFINAPQLKAQDLSFNPLRNLIIEMNKQLRENDSVSVKVKTAKKTSSNINKNAMLQSELQFVKMSDINSSDTNHHQREDWELQEPALKELAESIKQKGVIQPIVLRPNGKPGKYFLVCGERRYQASLMAGQAEIPAFIKNLTDEEAFDLQITENLQRKDVHPMKEAQAYKALMEVDPAKNSVSELAARFGKTPEYIAQRLSFNNLIPDMRKEFYGGKMLIGHAIVFSRLTEADQKLCMKDCKPKYGPSVDMYEPLKTVQQYIQDRLVRKINDAVFNPNDAELYVAAGACSTCPKKSGGGNVLFTDIKEKDRCFDGACFQLKTSKYLVQKLEELRADDPDMPVVGGHSADAHHVDSIVKNYLKKNNIKLLKEYAEYNESNKAEKGSVKSFAVGGSKIGKVVYIKFVKKTKSDDADSPMITPGGHSKSAAYEEQINACKATLKKLKQDGQVKTQEAIVEKLQDLKPYVELSDIPLNRYEEACVYLHLYDEAGIKTQSAIKTVLNKMNVEVDPALSKDEQMVERMTKAPGMVKNLLLRQFMSVEIYDLDDPFRLCGIAIRKAAGLFKGIDISKIEEQALADIKKQEQTILAKITDLEGKKKEALVNEKPKSKNPVKSLAKK